MISSISIRPFEVYTNTLSNLFETLPEKGKVLEIALRIAAVVILPVAYPFLGALSLIGRVFVPFENSKKNVILKDQLNALRLEKKSGWQEESIQLIRHSRKDDPEQELKRLRTLEILDPNTEKKLDRSIDRATIGSFGWFASHKRKQIKILFAQALEIQKIYQETHHVFIHGQSSPWLAISHMVKEIEKIQHPEQNLHQFKYLRAPCSTAEPGFIESTHRLVSLFNPFASTGIERYSERWFQDLLLSDNDNKVREELLSADAYFYNYSPCESALYFMGNNSNVLNKDAVQTVAQKTMAHFFPKLSEFEQALHAKKITKAISSKSFTCGNLFVICLPKKNPQKLHYRSHPFGRVCACHPKELEQEILDKLQRGILDYSTKCDPGKAASKYGLPKVPQYRLYLPGIEPGKDQKIFLLTPLSSSDRKVIKSRIRSAVSLAASAANF